MSPEERFNEWFGVLPTSNNPALLATEYWMQKAWLEATRQAYEDVVSICTDISVEHMRTGYAEECVKIIQARLKELLSGPAGG